jgi:hypothetical protein
VIAAGRTAPAGGRADCLIRPYTVTRGRTRGARDDLQLITLLVAVADGADRHPGLEREHEAILSACAQPTSLAEVSVFLGLATGVTKILVADLLDARLLLSRPVLVPDVDVLRAVIDGLRRL